MMPEIDGFEMVEKIRAKPETVHIPVIMVTTLSEKEDRLKAVEAGANDFISKPVDKVALQIRTQSLLRQKCQHDEIQQFQNELNQMVGQGTLELRRALSDLRDSNYETVNRLASAAEFRDSASLIPCCSNRENWMQRSGH